MIESVVRLQTDPALAAIEGMAFLSTIGRRLIRGRSNTPSGLPIGGSRWTSWYTDGTMTMGTSIPA
jgi:hypothetical protein